MFAEEKIAGPQGQAIDQQDTAFSHFARDRIGQIDGAFDCAPAGSAVSSMPRDPVTHLLIKRLRSGQINQLARLTFRQKLGARAFSRPRPACY